MEHVIAESSELVYMDNSPHCYFQHFKIGSSPFHMEWKIMPPNSLIHAHSQIGVWEHSLSKPVVVTHPYHLNRIHILA